MSPDWSAEFCQSAIGQRGTISLIKIATVQFFIQPDLPLPFAALFHQTGINNIVNQRRFFPNRKTPVTQTSISSGISTSIFFKLCSRAPFTEIWRLEGLRRVFGIFISHSPRRYFAVSDSEVFHQRSLKSPSKTTFPPNSPA